MVKCLRRTSEILLKFLILNFSVVKHSSSLPLPQGGEGEFSVAFFLFGVEFV